jgi:hypothetical protein
VTFADSVLHLVRAGARIDSTLERPTPDAAASIDVPTVPDDSGRAEFDMAVGATPVRGSAAPEVVAPAREYEPGIADLEAAVGLVSSGLATRVILTGFPSWPGLLWRAYQLAESTDVLILPTVVRPGGRVDIVITRGTAADG